jgi:TRAP-type C4-dicarboxylate transport system permease small subunit
VFVGLICWGSFEGAAHAWNSNEFEGEGALRVPVWPARFILILGTAVATFSYVLLLAQHLVGVVRGTAPQPMGTSH